MNVCLPPNDDVNVELILFMPGISRSAKDHDQISSPTYDIEARHAFARDYLLLVPQCSHWSRGASVPCKWVVNSGEAGAGPLARGWRQQG